MHISTTWGYLGLILLAGGISLYSRFDPQKIAPLSQLFLVAMTRTVSHAALIMIWLWLGWHFLFDR